MAPTSCSATVSRVSFLAVRLPREEAVVLVLASLFFARESALLSILVTGSAISVVLFLWPSNGVTRTRRLGAAAKVEVVATGCALEDRDVVRAVEVTGASVTASSS